MNYTTIEQSKKLLELGLNPETADMFYSRRPTGNSEYSIFPDFKPKGRLEVFTKVDLPCWSLGALLGMMPCIPNCTILFAILDGKYGICITPLDSGLALNEIEANNPFEAFYSMVIWLLENGYIKTEKK